MNSACAKLAALPPTSTARTGAEPPTAENRRTLRERYFSPPLLQCRDVGAKRRGLMRPVDGRMRYGFAGALYTPPPKMIGIYSPPQAANSARLCRGDRASRCDESCSLYQHIGVQCAAALRNSPARKVPHGTSSRCERTRRQPRETTEYPYMPDKVGRIVVSCYYLEYI